MDDWTPVPLPQKVPTPGMTPQPNRSARDQADARNAPGPSPRSPFSSPVSPQIGKMSFDVSQHIGLDPVFCENEVDTYVSIFECIAMTLNWPNIFGHCYFNVSLGKAQEVCSALALEQSLNYDTVKVTVLRAYEFVPETYGQNFRKLTKSASQTHMELAHEKASRVFNFD